ncbi:MAG: hypothetical protein ACRDRN_00145 [Sciscionella sp.]
MIYLIQAGGTALIIASTTFDTAYNWSQILPITAFVVAMALVGSSSWSSQAATPVERDAPMPVSHRAACASGSNPPTGWRCGSGSAIV